MRRTDWQVFEEYIEEFLRDLIRGGAELAKHRNVNGIELKDVGLYMRMSSFTPLSKLCRSQFLVQSSDSD